MIVLRSELACLLCARVVAERTIGRSGVSIRVIRPEHSGHVDRLRCPFCNGNLWLQDTEAVTLIDRRPLTEDELAPRVGRPRKALP